MTKTTINEPQKRSTALDSVNRRNKKTAGGEPAAIIEENNIFKPDHYLTKQTLTKTKQKSSWNMKLKTVVLLAAMMPSVALADAKLETCENFSNLAGTIMQKRQAGESPAELIRKVDKKMQPMIQRIVLIAYKQPQFETVKYKNKAVQGFRNEAFIQCMNDR